MPQPTYTAPNGTVYIAGGKDATCTLAVCPVAVSVYGYRPSIGESSAIIALYAICVSIQILLGWRYKTWTFMSAMVLGCLDEILGYVGRILLWKNPWNHAGFIMQIVTITIGPVFFSAAIYVMLYQIVNYISSKSSRFNPVLFYWIFIPCDIISLILQAAGGAISASASGGSNKGVTIALAGLGFQVGTLFIFIVLFADYFFRTRQILSQSPVPTKFKIFVSFLSLATLLILTRCCYRVYELNEGYKRTSKALRDQNLFIGLESVLIVVAAFALVVAHPGFVFNNEERTVAEMSQETPTGTKTESRMADSSV